MRRNILLGCSLLAVMALIPASAFAQTRQGTGSSGMGSSGSSFGSTSGFGSGSSGFGSSGFGSTSGFGSSGFGSTGMGMGQQGMGTGMGMGQQGMGMGQQGMGQNGANFIGGNGGNNQNQFLGGRNAQQQGMGMNGMNGMNQFGNNGNRGGNRGNLNTMNSLFGNNMNMNNSANTMPVIRPRQKVAFDYPLPKPEALNSALQTQLERVAIRNPGMTGVLVTASPDGEVVLRGAVKSEAHAKLAQNLVRLEPGVRSIRNELTYPMPTEGN